MNRCGYRDKFVVQDIDHFESSVPRMPGDHREIQFVCQQGLDSSGSCRRYESHLHGRVSSSKVAHNPRKPLVTGVALSREANCPEHLAGLLVQILLGAFNYGNDESGCSQNSFSGRGKRQSSADPMEQGDAELFLDVPQLVT